MEYSKTKCLILALVGLFLLIGSRAEARKVCRAVALSGSADRGTYEAGVLMGLYQSGKNIKYDVVTGVSGGGINAGAFSTYPIGQEKEAVEFLKYRWMRTRAHNIYRNWLGGIVEGFTIKSGLFSTSPLVQYISDYIKLDKIRASGREVYVYASDLHNQRLREFNGSDPLFLTGIRATSAVPGIFESVMIDDKLYVDGGVFAMSPVTSTIEKCREKFGSDVEIFLDVILAIGTVDASGGLFEKNLTPFIMLHSFVDGLNSIMLKDIETARSSCPKCHIRVNSPTKMLKGWFLGFEQSYAEYNFGVGFEDGTNSPSFNETKRQ